MNKPKKFSVLLAIAVFLLLIGKIALMDNLSIGLAATDAEGDVYLPIVVSGRLSYPTPPPGADDWSMAGSNIERTSWTSEEVRGPLKPEWYNHFDAYISQKVQVVAAIGYLYISASDGLHALSAEDGGQIWFYPTELPLGHSPTYENGVIYVGGLDKKIHAMNAQTGAPLWTYTAGAGFHTNPLVVGDKLFAGNRDGYFYAIYITGAQTGQLAWRFKTDGPILYSAAYKDGVVYFASNDMYAYALNSQTGSQVWKSAKLSGHGFHSYWPVVYRDYVVFSGAWNYRTVRPGPPGGSHIELERTDAFPPGLSNGDPIGPLGTQPGDWAAGTTTINASAVTEYFEDMPYRRTYFVLNRQNGSEYTFDSDHDGQAEYAPILYYGAKSGSRYPPAVGPDGVIYQANTYLYNESIPRGQVSGWGIGTQFISVPAPDTNANDEPLGYSIGGNVVYTKLCCDREAKAFDLETGDLWYLFDQGGRPLRKTFPDLFALGWDFSYWKHGDQAGPVPYNGRVYTINNNAVVAFSSQGLDPVLPPNEDFGSDRGIPATSIERSTVAKGLNIKATLNNTSWPLLIYQERYYEQNYNTTARTRYSPLFEVAGATSGTPSSFTQQDTNIAVHLTSTYGGSQALHTWVSRRSPTVLMQNTGSVYQLRGDVTGMAYVSSSGVQIATGSATVAGSAINESWLLVWDDTDEHRWMPVVISMQNRPTQVVMNGDGIAISYSGAAGYLGITPLYGMSAPLSNEVNTWPGGIPQATLDRVRLLNRLSKEYPQSCTETRSISANGDGTISLSYQYIQITDAWGTSGLRLAYLPTSVALAAWNGSPIRINEQPLSSHTDLNFVTTLGRVAGVANTSSVTILLPGIADFWRDALPTPPTIGANDPVQAKLVAEVQKMIAAGHLRPGYGSHGLWDGIAGARIGQYLADYYHNPAETIYTLLMALPVLPSSMQAQVEQYIQTEFQAYPPYDVAHVGWASGNSRDYFGLPPEVEADAPSFDPCEVCNSWGFPGENIYASYLYANEFGNAANIYSQVQDKLAALPVFDQAFPNKLNSTVIGYIGYLRLAAEANVAPGATVENAAIDYLIARAALSKYPSALEQTGFEYGGYKWAVRTLSTSMPDTLFTPRIIGTLWAQMPLYGFPRDNITGLSGGGTGGGYSFGIDFVSLVPELANFLDVYAHQETQAAVDDYNLRTPYWFVESAEEMAGEGAFVPVYDIVGLFQAKALILGENRSELEQYLDVPMIRVGDLYYMLNLVATLKASP